jgi:hypothetical protein
MYPLRNLELPTRSKLQAGSLSTAFPTPLSSCFFPCRGEVDLHKLPPAHHNLENSRATPSRLGGFTSMSNKCHKDCFTKLKCSKDHKEDSLNPKSDFSQITQTSQRGVGKSSQRLRNEYVSWMALAPSKGGMEKAFILVPQKPPIGN